MAMGVAVATVSIGRDYSGAPSGDNTDPNRRVRPFPIPSSVNGPVAPVAPVATSDGKLRRLIWIGFPAR